MASIVQSEPRTRSFVVEAPLKTDDDPNVTYYELRGADDDEPPPPPPPPRTFMLPSGMLLALCFAMFANSYALMNPVPYAAFMVLDFGLVDDKEDTGVYAGLIMTSFMIGRFLSSFVCGRLADKISRKFVIRVGLTSCLIFQLGFGLAPTYSFALASRLLMGLFNGLVSAAKAMLPDLFPPAEQATAMSLVTAMWNLGQIVGTAGGGLLAGFPKSHPYLTANLAGSILAAIALFGVELCLPGKQKPSASYKEVDDLDDEDTKEEETLDDEKATPLLQKKRKPMVPRESWIPIGIYSGFSLMTLVYDEAYPLWLLTSREDGGYAMHARDIGIVMSLTAVGGILLQIFAFPIIARMISATNLFRYGVAISAVLSVVPPVIVAGGFPKDVTFVLLIAHNICFRFPVTAAYTSLFCCINNSAPATVRGTVNGTAMAMASLFKAAGPTIGGGLYSWSLNQGNSIPWPFRHGRFVFVFSALLFLSASLAGGIVMGPRYDSPVDQGPHHPLASEGTATPPIVVPHNPDEDDEDDDDVESSSP